MAAQRCHCKTQRVLQRKHNAIQAEMFENDDERAKGLVRRENRIRRRM